MSSGPLDQRTFEAIEAFVLGTMPLPAREVFAERLRTDAALRAEVEQQQEHIRAVELGGVQRALRELGRDQVPAQRRKTSWMGFLRYAAVVTLMLGVGIWYMLRPTTGERLYAEHFVPDPGLPVAMSAMNDLAFQDAMVDYKLEDYEAARSKWSVLLEERPASDTLRYYSAMAALGAHDVEAAIPLLGAVAAEETSPFADKAGWYFFLALIHEGEIDRASAVHFHPDSGYAVRASAIQQALR